MQSFDDAFSPLGRGALYSFRDWPNPVVPRHGAGVYTIWHQDGRFIYVGMSGRGITKDTARRNTPYGIYTRLRTHASGRRSGDQFCVYVADRLVLPTLTQPEIASIASGEHQMDAFVRRFIHEHLGYRFVVLSDGAAAFAAEASIKTGDWMYGKAPADALAFKAWLAGVAKAVAEAAPEGGFLGFGGTQVSDAEKTTLAEISAALGV